MTTPPPKKLVENILTPHEVYLIQSVNGGRDLVVAGVVYVPRSRYRFLYGWFWVLFVSTLCLAFGTRQLMTAYQDLSRNCDGAADTLAEQRALLDRQSALIRDQSDTLRRQDAVMDRMRKGIER